MGGAIITCVCSPEREQGRILAAVKCWDIIADKQPLAYRLYLKYELRGPTILGCGRRARGAGRFIVHAHDMLTELLEVRAAIMLNLNSDEVRCQKSALRVFVIGAMFS